LTVVALLAGVYVCPDLLGVTVYDPLVKAVNVYTPDVLAVTVAVDVPVNFTVAPLPPAPLIVPVIVNVCAAELKFAVAFPPFTVTAWLVGVKTKPVLDGVTVYEPFTTVKL
jgi:hypothetical protein